MLIAHARDIGTYPASINPAVHFPPASNRILAGYFLDGVFCVHHSYFSRQFLAAFYQVVPVRFYCPFCTCSRYSRTSYFDTLAEEENDALWSFMSQIYLKYAKKFLNWILQNLYVLERSNRMFKSSKSYDLTLLISVALLFFRIFCVYLPELRNCFLWCFYLKRSFLPRVREFFCSTYVFTKTSSTNRTFDQPYDDGVS